MVIVSIKGNSPNVFRWKKGNRQIDIKDGETKERAKNGLIISYMKNWGD
jgi:hypothetical protein